MKKLNSELVEVLNKISIISIEKYNGNLYKYILSIFNQLTTKDRVIFLRGMVYLVFVSNEKIKQELTPNKSFSLNADIKENASDTLDRIKHKIKTYKNLFNVIKSMKRLFILVMVIGIMLISFLTVMKAADTSDESFIIMKLISGVLNVI